MQHKSDTFDTLSIRNEQLQSGVNISCGDHMEMMLHRVLFSYQLIHIITPTRTHLISFYHCIHLYPLENDDLKRKDTLHTLSIRTLTEERDGHVRRITDQEKQIDILKMSKVYLEKETETATERRLIWVICA